MEFTKNQTLNKVTPKDFFLNLGWLITLYGTIISFIALSFGIINKLFVDPSDMYYSVVSYTSGIRLSISWLVVVFPIFLILSHYMKKIFLANPELRDLWIRKWLIYLTLFLSSITFVVDLILTVNKFLEGDLSSKFFAKAVVVFLVAGLTFYYYFRELRAKDSGMNSKIFGIVTIVLVVGILISSFFVIGSPMNERDRKLDEKRVRDLENISWQISNFYEVKGRLPVKMTWTEDLKTESNFIVPVDPESGANYLYEPIAGEPSYTLCASFNLEIPVTYPGDIWSHNKGEDCFKKNVGQVDSFGKPLPISIPVR